MSLCNLRCISFFPTIAARHYLRYLSGFLYLCTSHSRAFLNLAFISCMIKLLCLISVNLKKFLQKLYSLSLSLFYTISAGERCLPILKINRMPEESARWDTAVEINTIWMSHCRSTMQRAYERWHISGWSDSAGLRAISRVSRERMKRQK